jgi:transposase InsO family protein
MNRKGNCWDNAVAESFFGTLETELIHFKSFAIRELAKTAIVEWIGVIVKSGVRGRIKQRPGE